MPKQVTLFARQPIHDRDLRIAGYELLFRAPDAEHANVSNQCSATADVLTRAMLDVGLDSLVGTSRAWINIGRDFLVQRVFEAMPPDRVVLEVLESVSCENEVLEAIRHARRLGFCIALDDFELRDDTAGLVAECDIIKLDCFNRTPEQIKSKLAELGGGKRRMLAEKVESEEIFRACVEGGAELFQGYFFTRPTPVVGMEVKTDKLRLMRVLSEINDPDASVQRLAELIQGDVGLAYRLLRYANSASLGRSAHFENVRDAITMLGLDRVRACATLMVLGSFSNKPTELARIALVRARYCQLLGVARNGDAQKHFAVGLFSVLDAYLDDTMENVLAKLPLDRELSTALIHRTGPLGEALDAAIACEQADWDGAALAGIDPTELGAHYFAATNWADATQSAFTGE